MYDNVYCDNPLLWEEIYSSVPSSQGLYFHELIMLKYIGYGSYYSNTKNFPSMWVYQMNVLYPDALIDSLVKRGFVDVDTLYNTISSNKKIVLQLLDRKGLPSRKSCSENVNLIYEKYSEKELLELVPFRKYILSPNGVKALQENADCDAFTPYSRKNPLRRFYTSSSKRYVKPNINFYNVDIIYDSIKGELYFKHATISRGNLQDLNLDFLYILTPKDITGMFEDCYLKAAIKARPITFRFFYDNTEIQQINNIESVFIPAKKSTKIIFSRLKCKKTKRNHIKNIDGVPDRIVVENINYYDYFSLELKSKSISFIETLTEKINLNTFGNVFMQTNISNLIADVLKKFACSDVYTISFSTSNYLGELIVKQYLGNTYTVIALDSCYGSADFKNYKIHIPKSDVKGIAFIWYLWNKELINSPNCFGDSILNIINKFGRVLYKNGYFDDNCNNSVSETVLCEHKRTIEIKLNTQENKFLKKCNEDLHLAVETIISDFGECWLSGTYISHQNGLLNDTIYEKHLLECKQMYNESLIALQQEGFYIPKWKNEFQLFLLLYSYFPDAFFQYRSKWLGLQSLDVFVPSLNIAFEYQGEQHYNPVDFFGGDEKFFQTKKRDLRKKELCKTNNVNLIYWDYREDITSDNLKNKLGSIGILLPEKQDIHNISLSIKSKSQTTKNKSKSNDFLEIFQYDTNLKLVGRYLTISEASKAANIGTTSIGKAIKGERFLAGGYFWYRGQAPLIEFPQKWIAYLTERQF